LAILFLCLTAIIALTSARKLSPLILGLERDLNLTAAAVLIVLFALSQFYDVVFDSARKLIALGFLIYSTLEITNNAIPVAWLGAHFHHWNIVRVVVSSRTGPVDFRPG
jgi:hypothetical protein